MNICNIKTPTGNFNYKLYSIPVSKRGASSYLNFGSISAIEKTDTLCLSPNNTYYNRSQEILKRFKTFSIKEYKTLPETEIQILRQTISGTDFQQDLDPILSSYKILKDNLDEKYPNGCVFISIGRSPALFAKMLQLEGYEVKFCPCATLQRPFAKIPKEFLKSYTSYLKSIGITRDAINNPDKPFVFVDYIATGRSLKNFEKILKDKSLKINTEKVNFISLNVDLLKAYENDDLQMQDFIDYYFGEERIKKYSPVSTIPDKTADVSEYIRNYEENFESKLMFFNIIDHLKSNKSILKD